MPYTVGEFPLLEGQEELLDFLRREFAAIEQSQVETQELELRTRNAPPSRPRKGMKVYADGTDWDPGNGEGSYTFDGTSWVKDIVAADLGALAYLNEAAYANIQDVTADRLLGRTGTDGTIEELSLGAGLSFSGNTLVNTVTGGKHIGVWTPADFFFPTTNYAQLDTLNDRPVADFDATTTEEIFIIGATPANYAGEEIFVTVYFAMESATSGSVFWRGNLENMTGKDLDIDNFATDTGAQFGAVPSTAGELTSVTFSFPVASGGNDWLDGLTANNLFRMSLIRDADESNDTATGDAQVLAVVLRW